MSGTDQSGLEVAPKSIKDMLRISFIGFGRHTEERELQHLAKLAIISVLEREKYYNYFKTTS